MKMETKHVHEQNPKRTLVSIVIFIAVIVVGLITLKPPELKYLLSPQQTVDLSGEFDYLVYPYELEYIISGETDTVLLVDMRDRFAFGSGHIPGAENITAIELIEPDNIKRLNEFSDNGITVVLYDDDQLQANGPWMVLTQLGFKNVKVLMGGYAFYKDWSSRLGDTYYEESYLRGIAKYDYAEVCKPAGMNESPEPDKTVSVKVKRRKKTAVVAGGC